MRQDPNFCPTPFGRMASLCSVAATCTARSKFSGPNFASSRPWLPAYPDIQFVLPVMGWPIDLTNEGHDTWKRALATASACDNVAIKIFGMECIFGIRWTVAQIRPWILDTVELFGPDRCMFASHLPICKLACSVQ